MILNGVICVLNAIMFCGARMISAIIVVCFMAARFERKKRIQDNFDFFDMEFRFEIVLSLRILFALMGCVVFFFVHQHQEPEYQKC